MQNYSKIFTVSIRTPQIHGGWRRTWNPEQSMSERRTIMKPKVYIDGKEGTTGLQIYDRLASRNDIELLLIDETKRKDPDERKKLINAADITFLCLPDAAAKEAVSFVEKDFARIIDASTAHRTAPGWAYGIPELSDMHKDAVVHAKFTANPGCHASGFVIPVYPLVASGMIPKETPLTVFSLTGYSGGGKKMIAQYDTIVIAAPYWDMMFPSALKIYYEHISVSGITFAYGQKGEEIGLCKAKKAVYITTSGGYIGNRNFGYEYTKSLFNFMGINDIYFIKAEGLDII